MSNIIKGHIVIITLFIVLFVSSLAHAAGNIRDWYEAADGYSEVYDIAKKEKRPLIVYFHVEWCGYCQRMNSEFLGDYDVDKLISNYLRVKINPEDGKKERMIANKYGAKGYPTFLITFPSGNNMKRVHPFKKGGKVWSTERFRNEIRRAIDNTRQ